MTREAFIKKWLGNKDYQYTEQNRDLMRDDLDEVINQALRQPAVMPSLPNGQRRCFNCGTLLDKEELFCSDCRHNGKILAKGGINSTTDELCRNVAKSANAHSNYHQPAFCQYIVSCRFSSGYNLTN